MFCSSCGKSLNESHMFCPSCGTKKESSTLPKENTKQKKFTTVWLKIMCALGVAVLLGGIALSNIYNVIMGILIFGVNFASLKSTSKTIQQLIFVISLVIMVVAVINLGSLSR
ncbi:MAG: zinc-ribbon domain-containing protein [Thaumarchaeota archaeon]|nr:zinc-ribbon domain-containing protein [Nitrososphaerota archaeon]